MADEDSFHFQDSRGGIPGNIQIPQEDATVGGALVASQGSAAVFQQREHRTLLEIEQDEVVLHKGDHGQPGFIALVLQVFQGAVFLLGSGMDGVPQHGFRDVFVSLTIVGA